MIGNVPEGMSYNIDWDAFRAEAAKDILAEMFNPFVDINDQVRIAIEVADELIKQLKEGNR